MKTFRKYGRHPFQVAVIHGGPGAAGEMASVARELAPLCGVLEPLQTAHTVEGQVGELKTVLEQQGDLPAILVGFSWGAMLSFMLAARHPRLVKKLIMVGSGVFEERYAEGIMEARLGRLGEGDRAEAVSLMEALNGSAAGEKDALMARFGALMSAADSFDPLPHDSEVLDYSYDIHRSVWQQASELRASGELLAMGREIRCPVVAIHGDHDPHLPEGVKGPLSTVLGDFRFVLLERCGHCPWQERWAREEFYRILKREITGDS